MTFQAQQFATLPALHRGQQWVISVDTLVERVHFNVDAPADALGYKSLAVNLSDMAAMGATPRSAQVAWSDPYKDASWRELIQRAIKRSADAVPMSVDMAMLSAPQRQISVQIFGEVARGSALTRGGARAGDQLWVSGTLGDAGAGLAILQNRMHTSNREDREYLLARLHRPTPRLALGRALRGVATAAIDVSDGVAGDASHLVARSKVGLRIFAHRLPQSPALRRVAGQERAQQLALAAGEDYELAFSAPSTNAAQVQQAARLCQLHVQCVGEFVDGDSLVLLDEQMRTMRLPAAYDHFADIDHDNENGNGCANDTMDSTQ